MSSLKLILSPQSHNIYNKVTSVKLSRKKNKCFELLRGPFSILTKHFMVLTDSGNFPIFNPLGTAFHVFFLHHTAYTIPPPVEIKVASI